MQEDLKEAMKARDGVTLRVVRTLLAAIANAEAVPVESRGYEPVAGLGAGEAPRRELSAADVQAIITGELAERRRVADQLRAHGRNEEAAALDAEIAVARRYTLPNPF